MSDRTSKEQSVVVEALVEFGYHHLEENPERARRAWVLAAELAMAQGANPEDALKILNTPPGSPN